MAAVPINIFTPYQQHVLLIVALVALVALGGLVFYGLASYVSAFLGAGILYVALRPWFTVLVHRRGWNRQLVTVGLLLSYLGVLLQVFAEENRRTQAREAPETMAA